MAIKLGAWRDNITQISNFDSLQSRHVLIGRYKQSFQKGPIEIIAKKISKITQYSDFNMYSCRNPFRSK